MLVLICMLPAGMCTQQTRGSHYCAAVTRTPANLPGSRTTHIEQFTHKRLYGDDNSK